MSMQQIHRPGDSKLRLIGDQLHDLSGWLKRPTEQKLLSSDFRATQKNAQFLRDLPPLSETAPIVLIAAVDSPFYEVKQLSMMAVGLRLQGWRPVVLTNSPRKRWNRRYFGAFGLCEFVYWDLQEISKSERTTAEGEADRMLAAEPSFQDIKNWSHESCWIGPQILSSISRASFVGTPDVSDPDIRAQLKRRLPDTLLRVLKARKILNTVQPKMMLIVEANYAKYAPITDLAVGAGINVIQVIQPNRDDALTLRRLTKTTRREHPSSLAKSNYLKIREEPWTQEKDDELTEIFEGRYGGRWYLQSRNQPGTRTLSRDEIGKELGLDPKLKVAGVFSHVLWDANLFFGEDLFDDYGHWFVETVKAACANPAVNWLIKLHPANVWKRARESDAGELAELVQIRQHIGELPDHVKLLHPDTTVGTRALFDLCDYGITVRGTVGLELPCFGVTTFTAGTGRCDRFGFTVDSETKEEYLGHMANIQDFGPPSEEQIRWAKSHAHAVFCQRPWMMKSFRAEFGKSSGRARDRMEQNLFLTAGSTPEIEANDDLGKWARWAAESDNVDYLDPPLTGTADALG
jgi:hypothetical protein